MKIIFTVLFTQISTLIFCQSANQSMVLPEDSTGNVVYREAFKIDKKKAPQALDKFIAFVHENFKNGGDAVIFKNTATNRATAKGFFVMFMETTDMMPGSNNFANQGTQNSNGVINAGASQQMQNGVTMPMPVSGQGTQNGNGITNTAAVQQTQNGGTMPMPVSGQAMQNGNSMATTATTQKMQNGGAMSTVAAPPGLGKCFFTWTFHVSDDEIEMVINNIYYFDGKLPGMPAEWISDNKRTSMSLSKAGETMDNRIRDYLRHFHTILLK